ncbi:hypothetical protein, partial [Acidithiobacillus ferrooxidans]|uniref:hypothetical protein n=1 Tax=Acidithiobacillus ferrooxidans TaxID=920 RepID=UPI0018C86403
PCDKAARRARESDLPVAPGVARAAVLPVVRAADFAPSAAAPLCDNARRRSSAAARVERGDAVLFAIESLMP